MKINELLHEEDQNLITYDEIIKKFPEAVVIADLNDVGEWMGSYGNPSDPKKLKYILNISNISIYKDEIQQMLDTYDEFPRDKARTMKIVNLIKKTKRQLPIFVDSENFIMEGRHRIVAFHLMGFETVPVITVTK